MKAFALIGLMSIGGLYGMYKEKYEEELTSDTKEAQEIYKKYQFAPGMKRFELLYSKFQNPLHYLACFNDEESLNVLKSLLHNSINVSSWINAQGAGGHTPLYWAEHFYNDEAIKLLKERGAENDTTWKTNKFKKALAEQLSNDSEVAQQIYKKYNLDPKGWDFEYMYKDLENPIHFFGGRIKSSYPEYHKDFEILLKNSKNVSSWINARNLEDRTPLNFAERNDNDQAANLLKKYGAH